MIKKPRVISGMRATGPIHLGNLHGTLSSWISLQNKYKCFFFIADWHALTTNYNKPNSISNHIETIMLDWLSIGLDSNQNTLFIQSLVPEHSELYLYLSMITPISWLDRNPTYKDQIIQNKNKNLSTIGFLGYPVIQAADILIYKADMVPVGKDQVPHIEITREIARRFNQFYGKIFPEPNEILTSSSKILGLNRKKMSKSYNNAIFLCDSSENIFKKISKMITDPQREKKTDPGNPEICNVFEFHKLYSKIEICNTLKSQCKSAEIGCVDCKKIMGTNLVNFITPFQEKRRRLKRKRKEVKEIFIEGSKKARKIARETISEIREIMKIKL